ncbi:MAG: hypothetical protein HY043_18710 [Verrucomicrobia bacterium]|nr:hypothetical protein [Verrucomicrobiota bacterium]
MKTKSQKPARKPVNYPATTLGSRVAARGRKKANAMTEEQLEEYFRRGMVLIYGGQLPEKTVTGH